MKHVINFLILMILAFSSCKKQVFFVKDTNLRLENSRFDIVDLQFVSSDTFCKAYILTRNCLIIKFVVPFLPPDTIILDKNLGRYDHLVVEPNEKGIYLLNKRFEMAERIDLLLKRRQILNRACYQSDGKRLSLYIRSYNRPIFTDSTILITTWANIPLQEFYNHSIEGVYNFTLDSATMHLHYPTCYSGTNWWHVIGNELSRIPYIEGQLLYSFPMSDTLFIYNYQGDLLKKVNAPSIYLRPFPPQPYTDSIDRNLALSVRYVAQIQLYGALIRDPFAKRYYRIAIHEQNIAEQNRNPQCSEKPWSIMILNENLEFVGEQEMETAKYSYSDIVVVKEGLLIRNEYFRDTTKRKFQEYTLFKRIN